jgi:hypothetical protein
MPEIPFDPENTFLSDDEQGAYDKLSNGQRKHLIRIGKYPITPIYLSPKRVLYRLSDTLKMIKDAEENPSPKLQGKPPSRKGQTKTVATPRDGQTKRRSKL